MKSRPLFLLHQGLIFPLDHILKKSFPNTDFELHAEDARVGEVNDSGDVVKGGADITWTAHRKGSRRDWVMVLVFEAKRLFTIFEDEFEDTYTDEGLTQNVKGLTPQFRKYAHTHKKRRVVSHNGTVMIGMKFLLEDVDCPLFWLWTYSCEPTEDYF